MVSMNKVAPHNHALTRLLFQLMSLIVPMGSMEANAIREPAFNLLIFQFALPIHIIQMVRDQQIAQALQVSHIAILALRSPIQLHHLFNIVKVLPNVCLEIVILIA